MKIEENEKRKRYEKQQTVKEMNQTQKQKEQEAIKQYNDWMKKKVNLFLTAVSCTKSITLSVATADISDLGLCPGQFKIYSGPEVIKLFSCSTQLSMKFFMLINLKLQTVPNSFLLNIAEHENFSANKYENANLLWHFYIY